MKARGLCNFRTSPDKSRTVTPDRDHIQSFKKQSSKRVAIALFFTLYLLLGIWSLGLHLLATLLTLIVTTLLLLGWLATKIARD